MAALVTPRNKCQTLIVIKHSKLGSMLCKRLYCRPGEDSSAPSVLGWLWCRPAVPNLSGTRDRFRGIQFFLGWGHWGNDSGGNASNGVDGEQRGADGERQVKRHSLARRSPPAVRPGS